MISTIVSLECKCLGFTPGTFRPVLVNLNTMHRRGWKYHTLALELSNGSSMLLCTSYCGLSVSAKRVSSSLPWWIFNVGQVLSFTDIPSLPRVWLVCLCPLAVCLCQTILCIKSTGLQQWHNLAIANVTGPALCMSLWLWCVVFCMQMH